MIRNTSVILLRVTSLCIVGLLISCLVTSAILFNPYIVGVVDSLILQAPCCEDSSSNANGGKSANLSVLGYCFWNIATFAMKFIDGMGNDSYCSTLCEKYRTARCHVG